MYRTYEVHFRHRILAAVLAWGLAHSTSSATTIRVPDDVPTIQGAIDASVTGDTIRVAAGRLKENLMIQGKIIHILGAGSDSTVLDGPRQPYEHTYCIDMTGAVATPSTIRGMTVTGQQGIRVLSGARVAVESCCFRNFHLQSDGIVGVQGFNSSATVRRCRFHENSMASMYYACVILTALNAVVVFEENLIYANSSQGGYGILIEGGTAVVRHNTIIGNDFDYVAVHLANYGNSGTVSDNVICFNSGRGLMIDTTNWSYSVEYNDVFGNADDAYDPPSIGSSSTNMSVDPEVAAPEYLPDVTSPLFGAASDRGNIGIQMASAACGPLPVCGDGFIEEDGICDDSNAVSCDGCSDVCEIDFSGDVNGNASLTSADIIYLVNYVFKGGAQPVQGRVAGDVNCDGGVTSADIIYLVNFMFLGGGPFPCNMCNSPLYAGITVLR